MRWLGGVTSMIVGVMLAAAPIAWADSLWVGTLERSNVTIREIKDGQIYYEIGGRMAQPIEMDKVARLQVGDEPALSAGETAFVAGNWNEAAEQYQRALQTSRRDWVKDYAIPRLLEASNKAGRFDAATTAYLQLVMRNPRLAPRYKPQVPQGDNGYVHEAAAEVQKALDDPSLKAAQRQPLLLFMLDIQRARGDNAAIERVADELARFAQAVPDASPQEAARLKLGLAQVALDEGDYQKAIEGVESAADLFVGPEQMVDALFVLARSKYGLAHQGGDAQALQDAGVAFMRVVAHFKDHPEWPQVSESLYMTGVVMQELKDPASARELYEQVIRQYPNQPAATKAKESLAQLKVTN